MALISMLSAKYSPGASTAALAAAYRWPGPVTLVEADPAGADSHAGLLRGVTEPVRVGLLPLTLAVRAGDRRPDVLRRQSVFLDEPGGKLLVPGLADPAQSGGIEPWWGDIAELLRAQRDGDVLADCGRFGQINAPAPLWQEADLVVLVLRPLASHVHLARLQLRALAASLDAGVIPAHERVALLLVDEPGGGDLREREVVKHTRLPDRPELGYLGMLPVDPGAVAVLSGRAKPGRNFERSGFMRAASQIARNASAAAGALLLSRNSNILLVVGCVADFLLAEHGRYGVGLLLASV